MSTLDDLLDEVRRKIEATLAPLDEARIRLALTRKAAGTFRGSLRTYRSGSLAVHTMNEPVTDGDGGLVLNRNYYPKLGPDGSGEAPDDTVDELCAHLGPIIRQTYPNAKMHKSKRGPKIHFGAAVDGQDPTVDLVLAMNRREGAGIWIPNLETGTWDASDPEGHVTLFNTGAPAFRSTRRKITRLAKAWNKQFSSPGASSFEVSVWAYEFVEPGMGVVKGLWTLFDRAATRLEAGDPTKDPSGVSANLLLLKDASTVAARLRKAANAMADALSASDDDDVRAALGLVFFNYIESPALAELKASASLVGTGKAVPAATFGIGIAALTTAGARSFGGRS